MARVVVTDAAIVRIFNTCGPRMRPDDGRVVSTFIAQALRGEALTVHGDGPQTRSDAPIVHRDLPVDDPTQRRPDIPRARA